MYATVLLNYRRIFLVNNYVKLNKHNVDILDVSSQNL